MLEKILTIYQTDENDWEIWGDKALFACFEKAKEYIPKEFLDLYEQNHGFHDWNISKVTFDYACNGKLDILLMLGYKSKTASLVFPCCYNLRLGGTLCPIDDDIFIKNEILLCAFDRLDDGSFEIGFAISDNSYIVFSSTSLAVKCIV